MKTVLVTGASGFIGRHLVAALVERGCHVRCLVRRSSCVRPLTRVGAELWRGDVTDSESLGPAVAGVDVVFHSAGLTRALRVAELMRVNGQGTWNVAQACAAQPRPPVLVYVSSLAAAGPAPTSGCRQESDPPTPVSNYGRSKRAGEVAAERWADRVPTTVVRPGIVFGPANREMLDIFRMIRIAGLHVSATFSPPPLSLIYVDDLVQVLLLAAEKGTRLTGRLPEKGRGRPPGYYFACDTQYPTYTELGRWIARALGRRHVCLLSFVGPFPWLMALGSDLVMRCRGVPHVLNLDKMREGVVASWASSPAAVREDLGFTPALNLRERIQETVDWYRAHRWL